MDAKAARDALMMRSTVHYVQACAVRRAVAAAHKEWSNRIRVEAELCDLHDWCVGGAILPSVAAAVASAAAGEVMIVCAEWRRPVREPVK